MRILILATLIFLSSVSFGQSLQNTTWKTYSTSFGDTLTLDILTDTMHQYLGKDSLLVSSIFEQTGSTVWILDVAGPYMCPSTDTGFYWVDIENDTMTVHLIADYCISRGAAYNGVVLWKYNKYAGISDKQGNDISFKIYPNPSMGSVNIRVEKDGLLKFFDISGQLIRTKRIYGQSPLSTELKSGSYLVQYISGSNSVFKRLLIVN